jgi:pSer/pThr/pTyr-binding forkhead associated (FHA) protein
LLEFLTVCYLAETTVRLSTPAFMASDRQPGHPAHSDVPALPEDSAPHASPFRSSYEGDDAVISSVDFNDDLLRAIDKRPGEPATDSATYQLVMMSDKEGVDARVDVTGERFLIGRENCDLNMDDRFVSKWHAQLLQRDGALLLQDMGSVNGVYLRIADELALEDKDQILMGRQRLEFRTSWDRSEPDGTTEFVDTLGAPDFESPIRIIRYLEGDRVAEVLPVDNELIVGRRHGDIVCVEDPLLSAEHAEIVKHGDDYFLCDLDSDIGTFIRVHNAVELVDGDCFMIGRTRFFLRYAG